MGGRAVDDAIGDLERLAGSPLDVKRSAATGLATFVTASPKSPIVRIAPPASTAGDRARAFVAIGGAAFGLRRADQVRVKTAEGPDEIGMEHVRLQQLRKGVPVTGGELIVHLVGSAVVAVNGTTLSDVDAVDTVPTVDAESATAEALRLVTKSWARPMPA
jgi:hypothetical protein